MLRNINDVLGKNLLRDVFGTGGLAEHEAEVPPTTTKRLDLWFVPTEEKRAVAAERFTGILARIMEEPAAIELWTDPPSVDDYRTSMTKRELWREALAIRDKRYWPCPMLWHLGAGKPETIFDQFGYEQAEIPGWYRPMRPGLRVQIVVIPELPKIRNTLLLRLLGRRPVRREALKELRTLPEDAWEKQLAHPWLVRLGLEVPIEQWALAEDKEFVMDIQAWYKEHNRQVEEEILNRVIPQIENKARQELEAQVRNEVLAQVRNEVLREVEAQRAEERCLLEAQRAEERRHAELAQLVHLFEHKFRRSLTSEEHAVLVSRRETLGSLHIADLVLDLSREQLQVWLASPL